jgi:hypothetical protein
MSESYYDLVVTDKRSEITPYKVLGTHLHRVRDRLKETIAEVSGAVEINESMLISIEDGIERPTEDILLLLITHFGIQDDEAVKLWDLAGYDRSKQIKLDEEAIAGKQLVMVMTVDTRIVYSDKVEVVANPNGVVMNFMQDPDGPYQSQTVSRIGMSREQTESVIRVLRQSLDQSALAMQAKKSPSPKSKKNTEKDRNS